MTLARNSIAGWMFGIVLVSLALAPLSSPTDAWYAALMYIKVGGLVLATFASRHSSGPPAAWWFGFATLGWANLVLSVPGLWDTGQMNLLPALNLANLAGSIGGFIGPRAAPIVSFWFTIACGLAGGWASVAIDSRQRSRAVGGTADTHRQDHS